MIFCRKRAEKKNLFHFQFPSQRFPHGCDVGPSFRNAQVTHAGTPRGGRAGSPSGRGGAGGRGGASLRWRPLPATRPPPALSPRCVTCLESPWVGRWKSPPGSAVKQKERTENWQSAAFAAAECRALRTRGGGAARAALGARRRRARSTPPASPASERARARRSVHGVPPPPGPDPCLRPSPALTCTWDFGRGSRSPGKVTATSPGCLPRRLSPGRGCGCAFGSDSRAGPGRPGAGFAAVLEGSGCPW